MLQVARGTATLIKKDIFRNLMWYVLPDSTKQYPLTIERVRKIRSLNMQNIAPEELEAVEVVSGKPKEIEPEFVDVVGQISLRSLEKADKKRHQQNRPNERSQRNQQQRQQQQKGGQQQKSQGFQPRQQPPAIQKQNPDNRSKPQQRPPQRRPPNQPKN